LTNSAVQGLTCRGADHAQSPAKTSGRESQQGAQSRVKNRGTRGALSMIYDLIANLNSHAARDTRRRQLLETFVARREAHLLQLPFMRWARAGPSSGAGDDSTQVVAQQLSALVADKLLHAQDLEYCSLDGPSRLADLIADLRETGGLEQVDWGGSTGALSSSSRASGLSRRSPGSVRQQTRRSKMRRSDSIVPSSQRSSRAPHRANHRSSRSRNSTRPLPAFCARLPSRPGCRPPHARRQRARRCRLPSHRRWSSCSPRHPSRAQMSRQIVRCQQGKEQ